MSSYSDDDFAARFDDFSDDDDLYAGFRRGRGGGGIKCWECGGPHRKANCPQITCFACHGRGHIADNCPNKRLGMSLPSRSLLSALVGARPPARSASSVLSNVGAAPRVDVLQSMLQGLSLSDFPKRLKLYHGTVMSDARAIQKDGFKPSQTGQLGPGVYLVGESNIEKAKRFAHDYALRDTERMLKQVMTGTSPAEPVLVECIVHIKRPKFVTGNDELGSWRDQGHDAVRSDSTEMSSSSEWCLRGPEMIENVTRVLSIAGEPCPWKGRPQLCPYMRQPVSRLSCPCRGGR
mmetsp:Transcript_46852/g.132150  ORF Transcript_46852/g.132150 Transcript_46852/m.132150 type:complete len:292 (+) Transcript_46852:77-952(+)